MPGPPVSSSFALPCGMRKPGKPVTHRPHKPWHRLRRMHFDEVRMRIRVDPLFRLETEA